MAEFDPWKASVEDAVAAQEHYAGEVSAAGPIHQWDAVQRLRRLEAVTNRTGFDVLDAVHICAWHELIMPQWLVAEVLKRYRAVQQLRAGSWDDPAAFGRPYPKGAQIETMRRRRDNRMKIALAVTKFVRENPSAPLDPEWDRFGAQVAKSGKEAQKLFSEALKQGLFESPSAIRRSLGYSAVPPKFRKARGRQR